MNENLLTIEKRSSINGTFWKKRLINDRIDTDKIPDSKQMSDKIGKVQGKLSQKLKDPKTSQQFNKIFDMIDTLNK